jgi:hypothetical protein
LCGVTLGVTKTGSVEGKGDAGVPDNRLRMPGHMSHPIDTVASIFTAIGTVAVAILAIWGDSVRDFFLGPRLSLSLVNASGDLTQRANGSKVYYYHLRVRNRKKRIPAQGTRVVVRAISKRTPSGSFVQHPLVYPLQLIWTPMEPGEVERTIVQESTVDFGFVDAPLLGTREFRLAAAVLPNNFRGHVGKGECARFEIVVTGQNVHSLIPTVFEVSWNRQWAENQEEMKRHLEIRVVPSKFSRCRERSSSSEAALQNPRRRRCGPACALSKKKPICFGASPRVPNRSRPRDLRKMPNRPSATPPPSETFLRKPAMPGPKRNQRKRPEPFLAAPPPSGFRSGSGFCGGLFRGKWRQHR